jgi:glycine/D-amino acid oxidase-like deaminating enzyme
MMQQFGQDGRLPAEADAVIIGGGITGCATAWNLACRGVQVVLMERGSIGSEQSSRAWGFIRQQGRHPAEVPMAALASRLWETLSGELQADLEFVRGGILTPAETEEDEARMATAVAVGAANGLGTRMLTREEVAALLPQAKAPWRSAAYTAIDAHGEPRKATLAFAEAAVRRGAALFENAGVTDIEVSNGRIASVGTVRGRVRTGAVLVATGIGTAPLCRSLGISLPIQGMRVSVAETAPTRHFTDLAAWTPYCSFRATRRGTFVIGGGYRGQVSDIDLTLDGLRHARLFLPLLKGNHKLTRFRLGRAFLRSLAGAIQSGPSPEPRPNLATVAWNVARFRDIFPHLAELGIQRRWAGITDVTPDLIPIIGPVPNVDGLFIAAGFSGHGFALGPASGRLLAELITKGRASLDLHQFRLSRFAEGDIQRSPHAL